MQNLHQNKLRLPTTPFNKAIEAKAFSLFNNTAKSKALEQDNSILMNKSELQDQIMLKKDSHSRGYTKVISQNKKTLDPNSDIFRNRMADKSRVIRVKNCYKNSKMLYGILKPEFSCRNRIGRYIGGFVNRNVTSSSSMINITNRTVKKVIGIEEQKNKNITNIFNDFQDSSKSWQSKNIRNCKSTNDNDGNFTTYLKNSNYKQSEINDPKFNENSENKKGIILERSRFTLTYRNNFQIKHKKSNQFSLNEVRDSKIYLDHTRRDKNKEQPKKKEIRLLIKNNFVKKQVRSLKKGGLQSIDIKKKFSGIVADTSNLSMIKYTEIRKTSSNVQ